MRLDLNHLLHESDLDYAATWFVFTAFVVLTLVAIL
jgi:cytochrome oxidase assembly protein ShyY1